MGKEKKDKKIDKMEFNRGLMNYAGDLGGSKEAKELLERYDVEGYRNHRAGNAGHDYRGFDEVKKDLSAAMMNDYDTRRTIEAAAMAGNKDAKKFAKKGIGPGAKNLAGAHQLMKDLKKEYVGGGGMNGAKNRAGLTYAAVKADRDAQTEDYKGMFAGLDDFNAFKEDMKKKATGEEAAAPVIEKSDRLKGVEDRLENAAAGSPNRPPSLFDEENTPPAANDDQKQAASNFLEDYKLDVVKGANLKHDIDEGLSNASRAVRDAYGR